MAEAELNYNQEDLKDHFCEYCTEPIVIKNKKVKYCSDKCRVYAWRKRKKDQKESKQQ